MILFFKRITEFTVNKALMFLCFIIFKLSNKLVLSKVFPLRKIPYSRKIAVARVSLSKAMVICPGLLRNVPKSAKIQLKKLAI